MPNCSTLSRGSAPWNPTRGTERARATPLTTRNPPTMFKEIKQMFSLLSQGPKLREEMQKFQQRLGEIQAEGNAGGGMVVVKTNGRMEMVSCRITEEAMKL